MDELWVAAIGVLLAAGVVWFIHWLIMGHFSLETSNNKVILAMEVVALGCLLAAFVLGEVVKIADRLKQSQGEVAHVGLTLNDGLLVLGALVASLLIYKVISKL